jgi:hypothetical protein
MATLVPRRRGPVAEDVNRGDAIFKGGVGGRAPGRATISPDSAEYQN